MVSTINRVLFFLILGFTFSIFFLATNYFYSYTNVSLNKGGIVVIASIIFSLFFFGYIQLTGLFKEGFNFCHRPGPRSCRGGAYLNQGDSEQAKYCRNLASTPNGLAEINSYECGKGMIGMPGKGFRYTPLSDDSWENKRCDTPCSDDIRQNGIL
jgi:hypothetical protein